MKFRFQLANEHDMPFIGPPDFDVDRPGCVVPNPLLVTQPIVRADDGGPIFLAASVVADEGSAMGSSEPIVFESVGVDQKRQVGFLNMTHAEVDPAENESPLYIPRDGYLG